MPERCCATMATHATAAVPPRGCLARARGPPPRTSGPAGLPGRGAALPAADRPCRRRRTLRRRPCPRACRRPSLAPRRRLALPCAAPARAAGALTPRAWARPRCPAGRPVHGRRARQARRRRAGRGRRLSRAGELFPSPLSLFLWRVGPTGQ